MGPNISPQSEKLCYVINVSNNLAHGETDFMFLAYGSLDYVFGISFLITSLFSLTPSVMQYFIDMKFWNKYSLKIQHKH